MKKIQSLLLVAGLALALAFTFSCTSSSNNDDDDKDPSSSSGGFSSSSIDNICGDIADYIECDYTWDDDVDECDAAYEANVAACDATWEAAYDECDSIDDEEEFYACSENLPDYECDEIPNECYDIPYLCGEDPADEICGDDFDCWYDAYSQCGLIQSKKLSKRRR